MKDYFMRVFLAKIAKNMKKGIIVVLASIGGAILGTGGTGKAFNDKLAHQTEMSKKHLSQYLMMSQW